MKRIIVINIGLFLLLVSSAFVIIGHDGPQMLIVGDWEEVSWQYEKIDHDENIIPTWMKNIGDEQKKEISKTLIIHEAEIWSFDRNGKLKLSNKSNQTEILDYQMKGRGNILKLLHKDAGLEYYEIQELTKDSLVIHLSFDLKVRGIAKLTFKRI